MPWSPRGLLDPLTALWLGRRRRGRPRIGRAVVSAWLPDGEVRDVTPTPGSGFYALPSVAPDGSAVVFHGGADEPSRIWRTSLSDGTTVALTPPELVASSPSYSPAGSRIAFNAYAAGSLPAHPMGRAVERFPGLGLYFGGVPYWMGLYVMNADGTGLARVTDGRSSDVRPTFTADGSGLLFLRRERPPRGVRGLWRISLDPGAAARALLPGVAAGRPAASRDGETVYFFTEVGGRSRLARVPADGGPWSRLPNDTLGGWSRGPFCDPDGETLWYHCAVEGGSLCRLPLDGGPAEVVHPPGFRERSCAHASVSEDGIVAFDWAEPV